MLRRLIRLLVLGAFGLVPGGSQVLAPAHAAHQATPAAAITRDNDVIYGAVDGHDLVLDVALPAEAIGPLPAVILIHGGAMMFADRSDLRPHAEALAAAGYVTFNIDYRLVTEGGENPWPAQLEDAQRAVRWIRAHAADYGVDPERICAYGHSAGGVLAAQLGTRDSRDDGDPEFPGTSSKVACVIDVAGEMDLSIPTVVPDGEAIQIALLGGTQAEAPAAYRDISPITHVTAASAPFLILHGADDVIVGVEHSRRMTDALHQAGVEVVYAEYPVADHFVWLDWHQSEKLTLAFLARHLGSDD